VIIAISDLHIGLKEFDKETFNSFLEYLQKEFSRDKKEKNHFVLLGDIIEFSMRDPVKAILENEDILTKIKEIEEIANIYFLFGNHDIIVEELSNKNSMFPFKVLKNMTLKEGGSRYFFIHGYELDVLTSLTKDIPLYEEFFRKSCYEGELKGSIKDFLWKIGKFFRDVEQLPIPLIEDMQDKLSKSPSLRLTVGKVERLSVSPFLNIFLPIDNGTNLVFGHTHRPFITDDASVINIGSWRKDELIHNTFLKVNKNDVGLYRFRKEKIEPLNRVKKEDL
jgi:UDP-2,3-diacylglucosamine pyrophosphatase LpxH